MLNNAFALPATKLAVTKLPKLALLAVTLPVLASRVILPVVIPFLTMKFFVVILFYILINLERKYPLSLN